MSNKFPLEFKDVVSRFWRTRPKDVYSQTAIDTNIQKEQLLKQLFASLEFEGFPDDWDKNYVLTHLFIDGYFTITDTAVGVVPLKCGIKGYNIYDRPTQVVVANVVLGSFERTIGEDCALVALQYNYHGVNDLLDLYGCLLAECDASMATNLMNTKATFIAECESKAQSQSYKKMYDELSSGKPAVFVKEGMGSNFMILKPKENYIADEVMSLKGRLRNEFLRLCGIDAVNADKKERLIQSEVTADNAETYYNITHWIETIQAGFDVANELFGLNLKVKKRVFEGVNDPEDTDEELEDTEEEESKSDSDNDGEED